MVFATDNSLIVWFGLLGLAIWRRSLGYRTYWRSVVASGVGFFTAS